MVEILAELPNRVQNFAKTQTLFLEDKLTPHIKLIDSSESSAINNYPAITLLAEEREIETYIPILEGLWTIFLPGHQPPFQSSFITNSDTRFKQYRLENHPDDQGILQLIHNLKPQHVAFCHGPANVLADLCCVEELINRYHLHLPQTGKTLEILVGSDRLLSQAPSLSEMMFEGELTENSHGVSIELPSDVTQDNRWEAIADSGVILATWQGENLIIKGISQRELISNQRQVTDTTQKTCIQCRFYSGTRCLCMQSSMYRRKVSPEGFCPEYQLKE